MMAAVSKIVLLSYLDRNKVINIPATKVEGDVLYLKDQFKKHFNFERHVSLEITLQKFDNEWDAFVDLCDDYQVESKEKLKVVVSSLLLTPTPTTSDPEIVDDIYNDSTPSSSAYMKPNILSRLDNDIMIPSHKRLRRMIFSDEESDILSNDGSLDVNTSEVSEIEVSDTQLTRKRKVHRSEDDSVPLPNPFPLPKHFRSDVEVALRTKKMTKESRKCFFSAIALAMLHFKRYPSSDDYRNVATTICKQYDFLKSPVGSPEGAIIESLVNRFKEFRRDKKPRLMSNDTQFVSPTTTSSKDTRKRSPGQAVFLTKLSVPEGEDEVSFSRHVKALQTEFKKTRANLQVVDELMSLSFTFRRNDISEHPCTVKKILEKYPFLQNEEQLLKELRRFCNAPELPSLQREWDDLYPKVMSQAKLNSQNCRQLRTLLEKIPEDAADPLLSLVLLPILLPDSKSKPDYSKVIFFSEGAYDIENIVKKRKQPYPYLLVTGDIQEHTQCFLITDCEVVMEVKGCPALVLLAAYFAYNIEYPRGCMNLYTFLEIFFLKSTTDKMAPSVKHFLTSLS